jgi:hypothetical protein
MQLHSQTIIKSSTGLLTCQGPPDFPYFLRTFQRMLGSLEIRCTAELDEAVQDVVRRYAEAKERKRVRTLKNSRHSRNCSYIYHYYLPSISNFTHIIHVVYPNVLRVFYMSRQNKRLASLVRTTANKPVVSNFARLRYIT